MNIFIRLLVLIWVLLLGSSAFGATINGDERPQWKSYNTSADKDVFRSKAMPWLDLLLDENVSCTVELRVEVPEATDALGGSVYVAGDLVELGGWNAAGLALIRVDDTHWSASVNLPCGKTFEYKYTRGSWGTVEKGATGEEMANRTSRASADPTVINDVVQSWADQW